MKLIPLLVVPLISARVARTTQQIPVLGDNTWEIVQPFTQEEVVPAIGVHFTTSYAVAAARYQNGTTIDLVRVAADAEYIELMSRWTQLSNDVKHQNCHIHTQQLTLTKGLMRRYHCFIRSLQRSSRRMLGFTASHDAAMLFNFMERVRSCIEARLSTPISTIAPAFPRLPASVQEDVQEALYLTGLTSTRVDTGHGSTLMYEEANAAYAGLGVGLCESWSFKSDCMSTEWPVKFQSVLFFNFDNSSFSTGAMSLQNAFQDHSTYLYGTDSKLGWWNLPVYEAPRAKFWAQVHEMILDVLAPMSMPPNRIVLLGDHAMDEEFKGIVKSAVWDVFEFDAELMLQTVKNKDSGALAARGAAELGWRDEEFKRAYISRKRTMEEGNEL